MDDVPYGAWFDPTAEGFRLRALCRSFESVVMRVGLAGVLTSLPYVLWWDLIRGVWYEEGPGFWLTIGFLSIWAAAIIYVDAIALLTLFGEIRITRENDQGEIFIGIKNVGWRRRFSWSDYHDASVVKSRSSRSGGITSYLALHAPSKLYKFGWMVPEERQQFLVSMLQQHAFASAGKSKTGGTPERV